MIVEFGHIALILALVIALMQSFVPYRKKWQPLGVYFATWLFLLITASFAALMYAHVTDDFSVLNVVEHSHTLKPMIYKVAGVWGNHEGSMMLWVWMLALWGFCVACAKRMPTTAQARVLAVQGLIAFGFLLFIIYTSNPFERADPVPVEGMDLNPLLQDLGLAVHPPLLYTGYVGFSIAFCFAIAALMDKKVDAAWASIVRPWVLAAWVGLTAGIASGAVWAYYELGWGGFWAWDPVENASLMPWLVGTALLHSVAVLEKRNTLGNWTVFLSILAFSFSLLGTFLVRSGILTSVHAFATDPSRGIFILALLTVAIGGSFLFYAWRAPYVKSGAGFNMVSREMALLLNNIFLFIFCVTVLMGTVYPVILNALDLGSISVGPPYYMAVLLPMIVPFALLMGAGPVIAWRKGTLDKLAVPVVLTAMMLVTVYAMPLQHKLYSLIGCGTGGWVIFATLYDFWHKLKMKPARSYYGMVLAHLGVGVVIIGITGTTLWNDEQIVWMKAGDRVTVGGKELAFLGMHEGVGANYERNTAVFTVDDEYMTPEKRWYPAQEKMLSEVAMRIDGTSVIYLVMGEQDRDNPEKWVVRGYYHPLALWMLVGAIMIAAGGIVSMTDRRRAA